MKKDEYQFIEQIKKIDILSKKKQNKKFWQYVNKYKLL